MKVSAGPRSSEASREASFLSCSSFWWLLAILVFLGFPLIQPRVCLCLHRAAHPICSCVSSPSYRAVIIGVRTHPDPVGSQLQDAVSKQGHYITQGSQEKQCIERTGVYSTEA